jgi:2-dehydropantoate 2-reductase
VARILIAGAGALGSVFGGFLRRAGDDVTLLGRAPHVDAIASGGLHIEGIWGAHLVRGFAVARDAAEIEGTFDAVLVTVKAYDTPVMAGQVAARLRPAGVVISLQNGLGNAEAIAEVMGAERVLCGRVIFGAEVVAAGRVRITVYADPVLIGSWTGAPELAGEAQRWATRLTAAGIPAEPCEDIAAALWGKVLYNAALNPLGALLGLHYGALGEDADTRAIMDAVIDEAFEVAAAEGVVLPWTTATAYRDLFYERLLPSTHQHRSSMLQDLERGRRTEIDAINGAVWKRGAASRIRTPANELLTRLVHVRERRPNDEASIGEASECLSTLKPDGG